MQKLHLLKFSRRFSVPCAPLSMLADPAGTAWMELVFQVHSGCDIRDVIVAAVFDCVKEFYNVFVHLVCWLGIVYNVCISHIARRSLVWDFLIVCVEFILFFQCWYE